ncbi:MAG: HD domain-containing protein [Candidatus Nanoarchaeia archaeon]|nr:HD domain-containing protein [Candidatus Nanoarchaeia archaeon]
MNEIDRHPDYKKMYGIAVNIFNKKHHFSSGPFDETFFTMRVFESAKNIIKLIPEHVKTEEILSATLFHDIGKSKLKIKKIFLKNEWADNFREEWHKHPIISAKMAKPILKKLGHSEEFVKNVCYLIENHDKRDNFTGKKSLELQIVQDADYLGDTGFAGFIRPFLWGGKFKSSVIKQLSYMKINENSRLNLSKINLSISKELLKKNAEIENNLKKSILELIDSELL